MKGRRLTPEDVAAIRQMYPGESFVALAQRFGVSNATISNVVNRRGRFSLERERRERLLWIQERRTG